MNRTLTAAVALAAGLGMAGLAHAQSNYQTPGKPLSPQQQAPSALTSSPTPAMAPAPQQPPADQGASSQGMNQTTSGMHAMRSRMGGRQTVEQAQQELKSQGLYNGPIDGIAGRETKTALSQFQQKNGLKQTASLDHETLSQLKQGGNTPQQPTGGATK
jgi:peptidoglycan hydrolase-like protein with peptidoglycan-binding domain